MRQYYSENYWCVSEIIYFIRNRIVMATAGVGATPRSRRYFMQVDWSGLVRSHLGRLSCAWKTIVIESWVSWEYRENGLICLSNHVLISQRLYIFWIDSLRNPLRPSCPFDDIISFESTHQVNERWIYSVELYIPPCIHIPPCISYSALHFIFRLAFHMLRHATLCYYCRTLLAGRSTLCGVLHPILRI
jgi:hypothetical protein